MSKPKAKAPRRGRAPRKLVCLETYWSDHGARAFSNASVLTDFAPAHRLGFTVHTRD